MDNKCPGCGAEILRTEGVGTDWETVVYTCGTGEESGFYGRECWANQCADLRKLVREMVPFVRGSWVEKRKTGYKVVWPDWTKSDEILNRPEVVQIMEGVE